MKRMRNQLAEKLPNEIMLDIFSRLDMQSLFRVKFACCKAWRDMIDDDPCFDSMHLARTAKSPGAPLLILDPILYTEPDLTMFHALKEDGDTFKTSFVAEVVMDSGLVFGGSCNGLLCFYTDYDVFICNPLLNQVLPILRGTIGSDIQYFRLGFGFDSKSNTYKIVHVIHNNGRDRHTNVLGVEVYTLGTNSWRKINEKFKYRIYSYSPVFAHGALHWDTNQRDEIVSFDLGKEEFYVTPCPDCKRSRLVELDGLLAIVSISRMYFEIWLCDGTKKWSKEYKIDMKKAYHMIQNDVEVMGMWNGDLMLKIDRIVFTYNPKNDYFRRVNFDLRTDKTQFIDFRGSLVSPYKFIQ